MSEIVIDTPSPLVGGGEMGQRIRDTDWSATPLGDYATWPETLVSLVRMLLVSQQPMFVAWGTERIFLYGDSYVDVLGAKHPAALGRRFDDVWSEIWNDIGPLVDRVVVGDPVRMDNQRLILDRHGYPEETYFTFTLTPIPDGVGAIEGSLCIVTETTEQVMAERTQDRGRTRLETALRVARLGTFDWQPYVGVIEMDARSSEIFHLPTEGVMSHEDAFARIAPEDLDRIRADTAAIMGIDHSFDIRNLGRPVDFNYDLVLADGSRRSILSSGAILDNADGTRRMIGTFNDVTDLRRAETRLRDQNADLEQQVVARTAERNRLWDTSPDLMLIIDFEGVFRRVNPAWTTMLGYAADELVGHHVNEFVIPDDHHDTTDAYELAAEGGVPRIVNRYRHKDGSVRWVSWVAAPASDMTYATGRDVTADKEKSEALGNAEEALRQSQKMEAVGQLTGGVAHDFNNLLTIIRSSVDFLRRQDLPLERKERYLNAVSDTVDRAAKLTGQLLAFARRQVLKPEVFEVGARLRGVGDMLETVTGSRIRVVIEVPDEPCYARADLSQFETALVNMAVNARDAMDGEGRLTLRLGADTPKPLIRTHPASQADFVALSVTDTGTGIPVDQLGRIFEPFFTTKEVGKGTGLGLSQVFGFAKQSGGDVDVRSVVGEGTTFTLYLPQEAVGAVGAVDTDTDPSAAPVGTGQHVLVVEDNVEVGQFCTQILNDLGYVTEWSATAEEALDRLGSDGGGFDVVFSDVVMPGMGGVALAEVLLERLPGMPVVLTSGYSHVLAREDDHGFEVLHKPYSAEQLARILQRVIAKAAPRSFKVAS